MPRDKADVIAGLKRKGFQDGKSSHHKYYVYKTLDGKISKVFTYVGHSGKDLSDYLLSQMARQCKVKREDFLKLIDCPLSQRQYEALIRENGIL